MKDLISEQPPPNLQLQIKVSKILSLGFVFSLVPMGGIGSLVALVSGLRARELINKSNNEIVGVKLAWWCIIVGAIGSVVSPLIIIFVAVN